MIAKYGECYLRVIILWFTRWMVEGIEGGSDTLLMKLFLISFVLDIWEFELLNIRRKLWRAKGQIAIKCQCICVCVWCEFRFSAITN